MEERHEKRRKKYLEWKVGNDIHLISFNKRKFHVIDRINVLFNLNHD